MNRIFEFTPSPEEAVVSRILMLVHQTMDQHLPSATKANRQFTKTVFSDEGEKTAGLFASPDDEAAYRGAHPSHGHSAFGSNEETSPDGRVAPMDEVDEAGVVHPHSGKPHLIPPSPPVRESSAPPSSSSGKRSPSSSKRSSAFKRLKTELSAKIDAPDWVTRITLVLLLAGIIMLVYVLLPH